MAAGTLQEVGLRNMAVRGRQQQQCGRGLAGQVASADCRAGRSALLGVDAPTPAALLGCLLPIARCQSRCLVPAPQNPPPRLQALQTLMARQRVGYDFEYFRCRLGLGGAQLGGRPCCFWLKRSASLPALTIHALVAAYSIQEMHVFDGSPGSAQAVGGRAFTLLPPRRTCPCSLDQPADAPVTVLSLGRSLLKETVDVTLPLRPTAPLGEPGPRWAALSMVVWCTAGIGVVYGLAC